MDMKVKKKLNLKDRYNLMTRDLDWEPTYQKKTDIYPYLEYEGIKIHDWSKFEDPFRLTMDAYRTYALTAARNCGVKCSLPGMKPVTKAATTWVNNSVFHW